MDEFKGFMFNNYRSIGNDSVAIYPLKKMNFIIGQNNIGKSNIVRFLNEKLRKIHANIGIKGYKLDYSEVDYNYPNGKNNEVRVGFPLEVSKIDDYISSLINNEWQHHSSYNRSGNIFMCYQRLLNSYYFKRSNQDAIWFEYIFNRAENRFELNVDIDELKKIIPSENDWNSMLNGLGPRQNIRFSAGFELTISSVMTQLAFKPNNIPESIVVPAIRRIGDSKGTDIDFGGNGIIQQLAKLQNPQHLDQAAKVKFNQINQFVKNVLEREDAQIEIPYERDMILVHMENKVLPLESLGTGIHEVIILAVAATVVENKIVCIEEPELHLHPLLQRKLLKYISEKTNNTYILTTHSAHLLDMVESEIFHIYKKDDNFLIDAVSNRSRRSQVCKDLGFRASDILQANCIIWVEGPSDRIYLNYWISLKDRDLIEGIHYSVMFYGGRLASHLTADDYADDNKSSNSEFISLLSLNRNSAILLDSDKSSQQSRVNDTKKRLIEELDRSHGYAWLTAGREIENYLLADNVEDCIKRIHPKSASHILGKGRWDNTLVFEHQTKNTTNKNHTADKVAVAKLYISSYEPDFTVLDLNEKISGLVKFIHNSN